MRTVKPPGSPVVEKKRTVFVENASNLPPIPPAATNGRGSLTPQDLLKAKAAQVKARAHNEGQITLEVPEGGSQVAYVQQMEGALSETQNRVTSMALRNKELLAELSHLQRRLTQLEIDRHTVVPPPVPDARLPRVSSGADLRFVARLAVACVCAGFAMTAAIVALTAWAMRLQ